LIAGAQVWHTIVRPVIIGDVHEEMNDGID
jgi:hypothetical protein